MHRMADTRSNCAWQATLNSQTLTDHPYENSLAKTTKTCRPNKDTQIANAKGNLMTGWAELIDWLAGWRAEVIRRRWANVWMLQIYCLAGWLPGSEVFVWLANY